MNDTPPTQSTLLVRAATAAEVDTVVALYRSVIGTPFCAWDDSYPTVKEAAHDQCTGNLYVLTEQDTVIGAVSIIPENELDALGCFSQTNARELGRLVISPTYRGKGLAFFLMREMLSLLAARGEKAVHMSVAEGNLPALKTYRRLGFAIVGKKPLYGGSYYLIEKLL